MAAVTQTSGGYVSRPSPSGLAAVVDIILDKGLVIAAYVRVALVGIELLTIDARIVIASVDTYLRFAEAVGRLDLENKGDAQGLPELMENITESGSKSKTRGALEGVKEKVLGSDDDDGEQRSRRRRPQQSRSRKRDEDDE